MVPADVEAAIASVARAFHEGEPTLSVCDSTLKDVVRFCRMYVPRMAAEGNTVVAVDTVSGAILGAFLNEDYCNEDPPECENFLNNATGNWLPTIAMIGELEEKLNDKYRIPAADRPAGRWFHLWMVGVVSEARGKSVGKKLAAHSVELARAKGFQLAFAECTGALSTHIMDKHTGAKCVHTCDYATWEGCDGAETLRGLPAQGHLGMNLMVNEFN
jgi:GNAT superfamily N-acetyltransferase